jgi:hypothetical protein
LCLVCEGTVSPVTALARPGYRARELRWHVASSWAVEGPPRGEFRRQPKEVAMGTTSTTRSIEIDAPVVKVFAPLADPEKAVLAFRGQTRSPSACGELIEGGVVACGVATRRGRRE